MRCNFDSELFGSETGYQTDPKLRNNDSIYIDTYSHCYKQYVC